MSMRYRVLGAATVGLAIGYSNLAFATFGLFVLPLSQAYGWARSEISLAFMIMTYSVVLAAPTLGLLIDALGVRRVLLPAMGLFAIAIGSLAFVEGRLWQFYLTYFFIAAFGAGTLPTSYTKVLISWFDENRGLAFGIALAGIGVGAMLIPLIVNNLLASGGLQAAYLGLAGLALFLGLPVVGLFLWERPTTDAPEVSAAKPHLLLLLRNPIFLKLAFAFALLGFFTAATFAHLVPLLVDRGVSAARAAMTMSALAGALTIGRLGAGWLLDRVFAPYIVTSFLVAPFLGIAILSAGAGGDVALMCAVLLGLGIGAELDFMSYLVSRYLPTDSYARNYGMIYAAFSLGAGLGPLFLSYVLEGLGAYTPGLVVIAVMILVAMSTLLTMGKYRT